MDVMKSENVMGARVLLAENDRADSDRFAGYLESAGMKVERAWDGKEALERILAGDYDVIVLDYCLPRMKGDKVIKEVRKVKPLQQIVVISSLAREIDMIGLLDVGADDVTGKSISDAVFVSRVKAALRRARLLAPDEELSYGRIKVNADRLTATYMGNRIAKLNTNGFLLLKELVRAQGDVVGFRNLEKAAWGESSTTYDKVRKEIERLRAALVDAGALERIVHNARGIGYALELY